MPARRSPSRRRDPARAPGRLAGWLVLGLLFCLGAGSVAALATPDPLPVTAPAETFSAARAFEHVQRIAARPGAAGGPAGERVVEDLVATLSGLGLDTRVQNAVGSRQTGPAETEMARVRNVVAVLPGTDPTGRLFLTAHHDSGWTGPGAADGAAGVSTLLETVRALSSGPRPRNDVVIVLTDAEGACRCGAEAFAGSHPLAADGGVVLALAARGTTGPPILLGTSRGDAGLASAFATAAPHPVASSAAVGVHRALPGDSDFGVLLADGAFTGLHTGFLDGVAAHHTPQDGPERLDRGTLQAMGDNALAVARELADRDLEVLARPGGEDATYFPVLGKLVRYPAAWGWPLAAAALALVLLLVAVTGRRGESSPLRTAGGAALALIPLIGAPVAVQGLWSVLGAIRPGHASVLDPWRSGWFRLAAVALVAAAVLLWYAALRRSVGPVALATGALVWPAILAVVLAAVAPGASHLAAWPAIAGAMAGLLAVATSSLVVRACAALLAGGAAVLVLVPSLALSLPAAGLASAAGFAVVAALLALAVLPALELLLPADDEGGRLAAAAVPMGAGLVVVVCAGAGLVVDRFDADHPVPSSLVYALDSDTGSAWWATTEQEPGEYTARYVGAGGALPVHFPYLTGPGVRSAPAEPAALPAPLVRTVSDTVVGGKREIAVRVAPRRADVRLIVLELTVEDGTVIRGQLAGRPVVDSAVGRDRLRVTFHAPPAGDLQASFTVVGGGAVDLRVIDGSDGLDGLAGFQPRPAGVGVAGGVGSDLVLVAATTRLG